MCSFLNCQLGFLRPASDGLIHHLSGAALESLLRPWAVGQNCVARTSLAGPPGEMRMGQQPLIGTCGGVFL